MVNLKINANVEFLIDKFRENKIHAFIRMFEAFERLMLTLTLYGILFLLHFKKEQNSLFS